MPPIRNSMGLPAGLGIPASMQNQFKRITQQQGPVRRVAANQYGPSVKPIGKGSLVHFNYQFWQHDPYPLVVVTDIFPLYIRGVNLHYLTFPYIKNLLQANCDNNGFSYYNIRGDQYIVNAFRTYKRAGIKRLKTLDCDFILHVLASVRALDPNEVDNLRKVIQEQIRRRAQPKAEELSGKYIEMMRGQQQQGFIDINNPPPVAPPEQI